MRPLMIVGLVLIVLGVLALGFQGVAYFTTTEKQAQIGPIEVWGNKTHAVPLAPILSGVAIAGGVVLMIIGATRRPTT
jgi:hypothetical protein